MGYDLTNGYGALTPRQFTHNSESIRVGRLAFLTADNLLDLRFNGDLGSSNYTLQLDDVHLAVLAPGNNYVENIDTSDIDWAVGEIVTV